MILKTVSKVKVVIYLILISVTSAVIYVNDDEHVTSTVGIVKKDDLMTYVHSLEKVLSYWGNHTNYETSSLYLGIFLMKVNLKNIVKERMKSLPPDYLQHIEEVVNLNKRVLKTFDQLILHGKILAASKKVLTLINNLNVWVTRLKKFRAGAWEHRPPSNTKNELMLFNWTLYYDAVNTFSYEKGSSPVGIDTLGKCLDQLSKMPDNKSKLCEGVLSCKLFLEGVEDYGYGITEKLLTLQVAWYGRGCYIYSQHVDSELLLQYCQSIYEEADFIADFDFHLLIDLFSEQIFLCALEGHAEFLQRYWFAKALQMQHTYLGCFKNNGYAWDDFSTESLRDSHPSVCSERTSGMMIGALSVAIRFILEFYY